MRKLRIKLRQCKGATTIYAAFTLLAVLLIMGFAMEYIKALTIAKSVKDYVGQAVVSTAAHNAYEIYGGTREGNTTSVRYSGAEWERLTIMTTDVMGRLDEILKLEHKEGSHINIVNGSEVFSLSNLQVSFEGAEQRADNSTLLNFKAIYRLRIPIYFAGDVLPPIEQNFAVASTYIPLF